MPPDAVQSSPIGRAELRRVLKLYDLILYGIILVMPIAAVPLFGLAQKLSNGHAITTIMLAMVAMTLTAFSYGRMAAAYPSAGSAYSYVGRTLSKNLGFLAGWTMLLDYLLVPLICVIYGSITLQRLIDAPFWLIAAVFAATITIVNLRGIRATSFINLILMLVMCTVIIIFIVLAFNYLLAAGGLGAVFSTRPFYNPATFSVGAIATGTSLAALSYGGFDGVSTLAEEVENPRRNVPLATVLVCLFTGIFGGLQIYLAQLVRPDFHSFPNLETAFMDVGRDVGGAPLYQALAVILIIANLGCGLTAQAGVSRLLFGMGRDNVLPRRFFAHVSAKTGSPTFNILLVGIAVFAAALISNYEEAAELINFGAFLAFMGVNVAAVKHAYTEGRLTRKPSILSDAILPLCGFFFCLTIWISLPHSAMIAGLIWLAAGLAYAAFITRGFRSPLVLAEFSSGIE